MMIYEPFNISLSGLMCFYWLLRSQFDTLYFSQIKIEMSEDGSFTFNCQANRSKIWIQKLSRMVYNLLHFYPQVFLYRDLEDDDTFLKQMHPFTSTQSLSVEYENQKFSGVNRVEFCEYLRHLLLVRLDRFNLVSLLNSSNGTKNWMMKNVKVQCHESLDFQTLQESVYSIIEEVASSMEEDGV